MVMSPSRHHVRLLQGFSQRWNFTFSDKRLASLHPNSSASASVALRPFSIITSKALSVQESSSHRNGRQCHQFSAYQPVSSSSSRYFSSNRNNSKNSNDKKFRLDALPFSISPEEALAKFKKWAEQDQGLRYLMNYTSIKLKGAYVPVWNFDMNIRYVQKTNRSRKKATTWQPHFFAQAYRNNNNSVLHLSGLSSYAGYSYRRSLIHPVHNASLVFLGDKVEPFGSWMLRDMTLQESGDSISVTPDAWNATQARAFSYLKEELQMLSEAEWNGSMGTDGSTVQVQTEVVKAKRVYMPTFVVDYSILGLEYRAFVSGCDQGAPVSGPSHQIVPEGMDTSSIISPELSRSGQGFLGSAITNAPRLFRSLPILLSIFRPVASLFAMVLIRLATAIPVVGVIGGAFAGFRKVLQPWLERRNASAEWERQRETEAAQSHADDLLSSMNDFSDSTGRAQQFYARNKEEILRNLTGETSHETGDYDWYEDWQEWARQQWAKQQQQQQQQQSYGGQTYQQQQQHQHQQQSYGRQNQRQQQQKSKPDFQWDFNPNDPYSVLGISRGASKSEVSAAFRKEMLKHHPDTQPNASDAQKLRNVERSKFITEAYRKIKTEQKR